MKYYLLTFNEDYADEFDVPAFNVMDQIQFDAWKKSEVSLDAYLGNCEGFEDQFPRELKTGDDAIRLQNVTVAEVTKEFSEIFHKNKLSQLSLCEIFG